MFSTVVITEENRKINELIKKKHFFNQCLPLFLISPLLIVFFLLQIQFHVAFYHTFWKTFNLLKIL